MGKGSGSCASRTPLMLDATGPTSDVEHETDWLRDPEWVDTVLDGSIFPRYLKRKFSIDDDELDRRMMPFVEAGYLEVEETVWVGEETRTDRFYSLLDAAVRWQSYTRWQSLDDAERSLLETMDPGGRDSYVEHIRTHTDFRARTGLSGPAVTEAIERLHRKCLLYPNSRGGRQGYSLLVNGRRTLLDMRDADGWGAEPTRAARPLAPVDPRLVPRPVPEETELELLAKRDIHLSTADNGEYAGSGIGSSDELEGVLDGLVERGLFFKRYHRTASVVDGHWDEGALWVDYARTDAGSLRLYDHRLSRLDYAADETMGSLVARQASASHPRSIIVQHGELHAELGIPPKELSAALSALVSEGILERTRRTRWGVTESGWGFTNEGLEAARLVHERA